MSRLISGGGLFRGRLSPELVREIEKVFRVNVERRLGTQVGMPAFAVFKRSQHQRSLESLLCSVAQIVLVRRHQHDLPRTQAEYVRRAEIGFRVRLVVVENLRR